MVKINKKSMDNAESVEMSGRAVCHLAADPRVIRKTGRVLMNADLAREYGFTDVDGVIHSDSRSVKELLHAVGFTRLAGWVPSIEKVNKRAFTAGKHQAIGKTEVAEIQYERNCV